MAYRNIANDTVEDYLGKMGNASTQRSASGNRVWSELQQIERNSEIFVYVPYWKEDLHKYHEKFVKQEKENAPINDM